jgi:uncharacterized membrane protein YoaK (UPF0700 family)
MKEALERWIHLNMALVGGFVGGYSILNHCDLFSSAQTANLITLAQELAGRDRTDFLVRIVGALFYVLGLSATVVIPRFCKANMKMLSIIIDAVAILIVGFLPEDTNDFVALYPLFVAMSIQWCTFKGAEGYATASIFSTNNLRQCVTAYTEYFCTKDKKALKKGKLYGKVLISFHIGVIFACLVCRAWGLHGAWFCLLPLMTAAILVMIEQRQSSAWYVRLWLGWKMLHPVH